MNRNPYAQCSSCFSRSAPLEVGEKIKAFESFCRKSVKLEIKSLLNIAYWIDIITGKERVNLFSKLASKWLCKSEYQKFNLETLNNVVQVSYEEFTQDPVATKNKMLKFYPELETLDIPDKLEVKDRVSQIRDFNQEQIEELKAEDIRAISAVLRSRIDLLDFFGYELI